MEKLCVVRRKRTAGQYVPWILLWFLIAVMVAAAFALGQSVIFFLAVAVGVVNVFFCIPKDISYDYTYYDGEMSIAKIRGDNKRKLICTIKMDDVERITLANDPSLHNVEHSPGAVIKNLTSLTGAGTEYKLIHRDKGKAVIYIIEPTEEFLDEIAIKYSRIITRKL